MVSEHMRRCPARSGDRAPTPGRRLRAPTVHAAVENLTPPSAGEDGSSRNLRSPAGWQNGTQGGSGGRFRVAYTVRRAFSMAGGLIPGWSLRRRESSRWRRRLRRLRSQSSRMEANRGAFSWRGDKQTRAHPYNEIRLGSEKGRDSDTGTRGGIARARRRRKGAGPCMIPLTPPSAVPSRGRWTVSPGNAQGGPPSSPGSTHPPLSPQQHEKGSL